jgi:hypothetical protein
LVDLFEYGLADLGFESRHGLEIIFFSKRSDQLSGLHNLLLNDYLGNLPVIKRPEREVDHSNPLSVEVKNYEAIPQTLSQRGEGKLHFTLL